MSFISDMTSGGEAAPFGTGGGISNLGWQSKGAGAYNNQFKKGNWGSLGHQMSKGTMDAKDTVESGFQHGTQSGGGGGGGVSGPDEIKGNATKAYDDTQGVLGRLKQDQSGYIKGSQDLYNDYKSQRDPAIKTWQQKSSDLQQQSSDQATSNDKAYTGTILPKLKSNMEDAMSLKDAQDPNNSVATGVRNLYNNQATGVQNQGVADYGVLAAMGSQATQGQIGRGMPMTGGQMQALQGANMGQASTAYNNAANYAHNLRTQGLQAGQAQSNWAYGQGQQAGRDYQGGLRDYQNSQTGFRNEQGGMNTQQLGVAQGKAKEDFGFNQGLNDINMGFKAGNAGLDTAAIGQKYGTQNNAVQAAMNAQGATQAGWMGMGAAGIGAAGQVAGASIGRGGSAAAPAAAPAASGVSQNMAAPAASDAEASTSMGSTGEAAGIGAGEATAGEAGGDAAGAAAGGAASGAASGAATDVAVNGAENAVFALNDPNQRYQNQGRQGYVPGASRMAS